MNGKISVLKKIELSQPQMIDFDFVNVGSDDTTNVKFLIVAIYSGKIIILD